MKQAFLFLSFFFVIKTQAQVDTAGKWLRAFPITDYIVDLNDSVKLVQIELPDGLLIKDRQLGLMQGVYENRPYDTARKGYGRCHLIKGNYYYFAIGNNTSSFPLKGGDLLYTFMDKTAIYYGLIPQLASHFITFQDVYGDRLFDRYFVFLNWTKKEEEELIDKLVDDIQFTGNYFMENDSSMNIEIKKGPYAGKRVLQVMTQCRPEDVKNFIQYILVRPRLYAGKEWKIAEVFATWVSEGAPVPVKE